MSHQHFLNEIATKMDGVYKQLDEYKADFVTACNTTPNPVAAAFPSFSGRPANLEEQRKRLQDRYAVFDDLKALVQCYSNAGTRTSAGTRALGCRYAVN